MKTRSAVSAELHLTVFILSIISLLCAPMCIAQTKTIDREILNSIEQYFNDYTLHFVQKHEISKNPNLAAFVKDSIVYDPVSGERTTWLLDVEPIKLGMMLKPDSLKIASDTIVLCVSSRPGYDYFIKQSGDSSPSYVFDPLPLYTLANDGNLFRDIMVRLAFVADHQVTKIKIELRQRYDSLLQNPFEGIDITRKWQTEFTFDYEVQISSGNNFIPLALYNWMRLPRAMVTVESAVMSDSGSPMGSYYGVSSERRKEISDKANLAIQKMMSRKFRSTKDKLIYSDRKFSFLGVPGLVSKKNTQWELIELIISYVPIDEKLGTLILTFQGSYVTAAPTATVDYRIIRKSGHNLEDEHMDLINQFLTGLQVEITKIITK